MIAERIQELKQALPAGVTLVAVSKFHPVEALREAYEAGQRVFGESRAQELVAKQKQLPTDIEWHFIGPLQSNKVKEIVPFISLIHSVDSLKLLQEIEKQAAKHNRIVDVLLEIHVAEEVTKHGLTPEACRELLASEAMAQLTHVRVAFREKVNILVHIFCPFRHLGNGIRSVSDYSRSFCGEIIAYSLPLCKHFP